MSYCLNPHCSKPQNTAIERFCRNCQTPLLLQNNYRILKIIGQGGMGRTFLAVAQREQRPQSYYVVKQFFPQSPDVNTHQQAIALFDAEAVHLRKLGQHSQIPQLYDYFTQDQHQYLIQEWIEGENLAQLIKTKGVFSEAQLRPLLQNLLAVLEFVHQHQIIHRDIKPENIILRADDTPALVDFGAAKLLTVSGKTGTVIGSAEYVAPEQLRGKSATSSDLYSLGVTCLYLLTGISPFDLYSDFQDTWIWRDYLAENPVSPKLGHVLDKMIARAIARRYQSAREALQDLTSQLPVLSNSDLKYADTPPVESTPQISSLDCTQLEVALGNQEWQLANQETARLLLEGANQTRRDWLEKDDLASLSCNDLLTIDQLWRDYSQGHFGFTVQRDIWQNLEQQNYQLFGQQVGWKTEQKWRLSTQLDFELDALPGHLPVIKWWFGHAIWGLKGLFLRLDSCNREKNS